MVAFSGLRVPQHFVQRLRSLKISSPTPVQQEALRRLMPKEGHALPPQSVVIRFPTGSGKTLAYGIPMLSQLRFDLKGVQVMASRPSLLSELLDDIAVVHAGDCGHAHSRALPSDLPRSAGADHSTAPAVVFSC